jgi:hypothetical protein
MRSGGPFGPEWVISGGAGRSATRQVKLKKRTLTARSAQLSFVQKLRLMHESQEIDIQSLFVAKIGCKSAARSRR